MSEIKNCPFCGNDTAYHPKMEHFVACSQCDAFGPRGDTPEQAEVLWNSRVLPPEVERLVKAAEYLLDTLADIPVFSKEIEEQINNPESQLQAALAALKGEDHG